MDPLANAKLVYKTTINGAVFKSAVFLMWKLPCRVGATQNTGIVLIT